MSIVSVGKRIKNHMFVVFSFESKGLYLLWFEAKGLPSGVVSLYVNVFLSSLHNFSFV